MTTINRCGKPLHVDATIRPLSQYNQTTHTTIRPQSRHHSVMAHLKSAPRNSFFINRAEYKEHALVALSL